MRELFRNLLSFIVRQQSPVRSGTSAGRVLHLIHPTAVVTTAAKQYSRARIFSEDAWGKPTP